MPLNTVTTGNTILASDLNQVINVLQRAAGQTETGKYFLDSASYAIGAHVSQYMSSLSRGATPVSVVIDTADVGVVNCNAPTTSNLTANGFHVGVTSTAINVTAGCAGNTTIQY
jgi:hypothetical protein